MTAQTEVQNTGSRPGGHVVQVYGTRPDVGDRYLIGSARVESGAGARTPVTIPVPLERLASWRGPGRWEVTPGTYRVLVGGHAADPALVSTAVEL